MIVMALEQLNMVFVIFLQSCESYKITYAPVFLKGQLTYDI